MIAEMRKPSRVVEKGGSAGACAGGDGVSAVDLGRRVLEFTRVCCVKYSKSCDV